MRREKKLFDERGSLIVEASIVFPVMFLVIFFMLVAGNAYMQKCKIEEIVVSAVVEGAAQCADPMLKDVEAGSIPAYSSVNLKPYRYIIGGMNDVEGQVQNLVNERANSLGTGFYTGMKPTVTVDQVKFKNAFVYSTLLTDVSYKIRIPVRMLGESDYIYMDYSTHVQVPVSDVPEFIRNVDFAEDMVQKYTGASGFDAPMNKVIEKVKEWKNK